MLKLIALVITHFLYHYTIIIFKIKTLYLRIKIV